MARLLLQDERGFNQVFAPVGATPIRAERRASWFLAQAQRIKAKRVLEIGCGTGEAAHAMARGLDSDVVAIDISEMFIAKARMTHRADNLRFERLDLLGPNPLSLGRFDLVFGNGILHHLVVQLDRVLKVLRAVTHDGGELAFIEPNLLNPYCAFIFGTAWGRRWARLEPDEMAFRAKDLRGALAGTGWHGISVATRDFLVPGLPVSLIKPVFAAEPLLEATAMTQWLAQSHFVTAQA